MMCWAGRPAASMQQIWAETGESEADMETAVLQLKRECLDVYRRKVEAENQKRLRLHHCVADKEAELAALYAVLGERPPPPSASAPATLAPIHDSPTSATSTCARPSNVVIHQLYSCCPPTSLIPAPAPPQASAAATTSPPLHLPQLYEKKPTSLRAQLSAIVPQLEEFRSKRDERAKQFLDLKSQIQKLSNEIHGDPAAAPPVEAADVQLSAMQLNITASTPELDGCSSGNELADLSLRKLEEYRAQLQALQRDKSQRLHKVLDCVNTLHGLCSVLGMDFAKVINDVHPSLNKSSALQAKSISDETLHSLSNAVQTLTQEKEKRSQMLQSSLSTLVELWKLLDTPLRDQRSFHHLIHQGSLTSSRGRLSLEAIEQVKAEVEKLEKLKASKIKELILKRRLVLEDVYKQGHMLANSSTLSGKTNALIDSGMLDASELLTDIEDQIMRAREEVETRKDILDRVEKWLAACEEERWLEDYNMVQFMI